MAKGTLTLREPDLKALSAAEWAARFGGRPVAEVLCSRERCIHAPIPHVHPRRGAQVAPGAFRVDPRTGRWIRPGELVGA